MKCVPPEVLLRLEGMRMIALGWQENRPWERMVRACGARRAEQPGRAGEAREPRRTVVSWVLPGKSMRLGPEHRPNCSGFQGSVRSHDGLCWGSWAFEAQGGLSQQPA